MMNENYGVKLRLKKQYFEGFKKIGRAMRQFWKSVYIGSWLEREIANLAEEAIRR